MAARLTADLPEMLAERGLIVGALDALATATRATILFCNEFRRAGAAPATEAVRTQA